MTAAEDVVHEEIGCTCAVGRPGAPCTCVPVEARTGPPSVAEIGARLDRLLHAAVHDLSRSHEPATAPQARVDWPRLITALDIARELHGGLSDKEVAARIGISASGICRLRAGKALNADGLAKLLCWLYPASRPTWITLEGP